MQAERLTIFEHMYMYSVLEWLKYVVISRNECIHYWHNVGLFLHICNTQTEVLIPNYMYIIKADSILLLLYPKTKKLHKRILFFEFVTD